MHPRSGNTKVFVDIATIKGDVKLILEKFETFLEDDYKPLKRCVEKHENAYWKIYGGSAVIAFVVGIALKLFGFVK